jgi:3-methylcrotonyl-CoA carboxylase alpha subunit
MTSFRKILIANRGEIAVRVIRTCRAMGISSVAVYSDADAHAPHVRLADEAVYLGQAPSQNSYLNGGKLVEAAQRSGCDAIHPGYGFLSENADFAAACATAGIVFIGPSPAVIRQMGSKSAARQLAAEADVPTVPGYDGLDQRDETLRAEIERIGFPVLIKASAGGGGKGMRVVRAASEIDGALASARREAEKSFGDGTLLLEKFIEQARHVEIQLFGDSHGNLVHLFERDCSLQRSHQKIIEESPSPVVTPELRERMGTAAVRLGRVLAYVNAGTVEFIMAPDGQFYFIEVNTRLQVEHPVTEMITGLDLVKLQIEIAEGKPLPFTQGDLQARGHAIEARLYAEDPRNEFLPATGTLHAWQLPKDMDGLRIDAGVERGSEIGIYYDPLLAKLIAHGADRDEAMRKLSYGLRQLVAQGVTTNREFLLRLLAHPDFQQGQATTSFIAENLETLLAAESDEVELASACAVVLWLQQSWQQRDAWSKHLPPGYRNNPYRNPVLKLAVQSGARELSIAWRARAGGRYEIFVGGLLSEQVSQPTAWRESSGSPRVAQPRQVALPVPSSSSGHSEKVARDRVSEIQVQAELLAVEGEHIRVALDGVQRNFLITVVGEDFYVHSALGAGAFRKLPRYPEHQTAADAGSANSPMPGVVLKVLVEAGQAVTRGEALLILEAMKMEHTLRAAVDGLVEAILVKPGEVVAPGQVLINVKAG